jgi:hypothetical protein
MGGEARRSQQSQPAGTTYLCLSVFICGSLRSVAAGRQSKFVSIRVHSWFLENQSQPAGNSLSVSICVHLWFLSA